MTNSMLSRLRNASRQSSHPQHKISALVLLKGRPIAIGVNDIHRSHTSITQQHEHKKMHAEIAAIMRVKNKALLLKCTLIVYREDRQGNMALSKPCIICEKILTRFGLKKIIYSDADGWKTLEYSNE